ncbi:hypothetical protein J5J86_16040 [Aquabacter sp. L1I39]|uniref:KAP family P-loop NTPase fold protein n=1 Tax=Aquabacter sp. L1I39 TaxID=2820278 RepID=UPI001AD9C5A5|nr:P-loop NTPase fold protein [Aquabacter sp. L1I39]QTL02301.1 hypothetical protein J5J86_16040 [Aquabacter sp. L1I39]
MSNHERIWEGDLLGRRADAEFLEFFLVKRVEERGHAGQKMSFVLNIDAPWGYGKTWFVDRFVEQLVSSGRRVAKINAWQNDYADDPLIPVMAAIDDVIAPTARGKKKALWRKVKANGASIAYSFVRGAASHWIKKGTGDALSDVINVVNNENLEAVREGSEHASDTFLNIIDKNAEELISKFKIQSRTIEQFRSGLSHTIKGTSNDSEIDLLFVVIDEMDRCRPTYAILLLERIKHIFETDYVVFIIATDSIQLQHSVSSIYGANFDSRSYLKRFFDRTYHLELPSIEKFVESQVAKLPLSQLEMPANYSAKDSILASISCFDLSLRDIQQCLDHFHSIVTSWNASSLIQFGALFPMIIAYHKGVDPDISLTYSDKVANIVSRSKKNMISYHFKKVTRISDDDNISYPFQVMAKYIYLSSKSFEDLIKFTPEDSVTIWIFNTFLNEMKLNTGDNSRNDRHSAINTYPALIRQTGRLSV